jgi:N-acylneuraminate cytidylyltransferase
MHGESIAIITARGGSKRIPRKNIKDFMGRPMLSYAIEAAKDSGVFSEIMVSTDDEEIAAVAKASGAAVPFLRSERTSDDYATTYDVLEEVICEYGKTGRFFDSLCCIYPCVPFLSSLSLCKASQELVNANAVIPVCRYPVPIEWAMKIKEGNLYPYDAKAQQIRSQDIEPKYYDVGMFYFIKTKVFAEEKTIVPSNTAAFIISDAECQDIDTPEDWAMAEMKYKILKGIG